MLSCADQCPKLMECGHRCSNTCHSGDCSLPSQCKKKVKITCACKRKKEEFKCQQAFGKSNLVPCDENCNQALKQEQSNSSKQSKQQESEEELRNKREAELFERQMGGGKRRKRRKTECLEEGPSFMDKNKKIIFGSATFIAFLSLLVYCSLY